MPKQILFKVLQFFILTLYIYNNVFYKNSILCLKYLYIHKRKISIHLYYVLISLNVIQMGAVFSQVYIHEFRKYRIFKVTKPHISTYDLSCIFQSYIYVDRLKKPTNSHLSLFVVTVFSSKCYSMWSSKSSTRILHQDSAFLIVRLDHIVTFFSYF